MRANEVRSFRGRCCPRTRVVRGAAWEFFWGRLSLGVDSWKFMGIFWGCVGNRVWIRGDFWASRENLRVDSWEFVGVRGDFRGPRGNLRVDSWKFMGIFGGCVGNRAWIRGNSWWFLGVAWEFACGFVGIFGSSGVKCGNLRVDSWEFLEARAWNVGICVWVRVKITSVSCKNVRSRYGSEPLVLALYRYVFNVCVCAFCCGCVRFFSMCTQVAYFLVRIRANLLWVDFQGSISM